MAALGNGRVSRRMVLLGVAAVPAACAPALENPAGLAAVDLSPDRRDGPSGVGMEGRDIARLSREMVASIRAHPAFSGDGRPPPQVIVDASLFQNLSPQRLNLNLITDRLRVELSRAAAGRMTFVSRENAGAVDDERLRRRRGEVDVGTRGMTRARAGADYRLAGRINSEESLDTAAGVRRRSTVVVMELIDMERGTVSWTDMFEFERAGARHVMYR